MEETKTITIIRRQLSDILDEMCNLAANDDIEDIHQKADKLLCDALIIASMQTESNPCPAVQIVEAFNVLRKWYS